MPKILVVDDSVFARTSICSVLRDEGFETIEAANGVEGLQKALGQAPDCIFTDLLMPEMDGFKLIEALNSNSVSTPVFVLSADIQESKRQRCMEMGVAGFLSKPLRKNDLLQAVESVFVQAEQEA